MTKSTRHHLNTPFHRLTEEEIRQWYSDKFITTACYLLAIRRITRPAGAKFVIPNVLEFCEKWGITKSAFYRAVNDLKRKGYTEWETTHGIVLKDSSKVLTFPTTEKCSTDGLEEQPAESRERDYESYKRDFSSYEGDTQAPFVFPNLDRESLQTIQITQTNQIETADEKVEVERQPTQPVVEQSTSFDCNEGRSPAYDSEPTLGAAHGLTSIWSSVSECAVYPKNPGQGKTSAAPYENDFQIPSDLRAKLEELQIPLDQRVRAVIASHDISQAYGAVAHVERTWETIDNPRGVFLFQIGRQPVEPMGSRLPVRTAAESGFTLEHLKKIYPNNWQDAAMYFGLEVA